MKWGAPAEFPAIYEDINVPAFFAVFADAVLDRAAPREGDRLLDVACGTGIVLRRVRERTPGLARAVGLDLTPAMLEVARERTAGLDIEIVQGDAADLPFEDGAFDVVTCQQGLQFFPERGRALEEFRRVLAPGGRAVVACWTELDRTPTQRAIVDAVAERFPEAEHVTRAPWALSDPEELRALVSGAGFADVEVECVERLARFPSPDALGRGFVHGSPLAIALAGTDPAELEALIRDIAERMGEPAEGPKFTNVALGRVDDAGRAG